MKKVITYGTYDLLHIGHINLFLDFVQQSHNFIAQMD